MIFAILREPCKVALGSTSRNFIRAPARSYTNVTTVAPRATVPARPTPIVMLSGPWAPARCWENTWQAHFARLGYTSTAVDLEIPLDPNIRKSGDKCLRHLTQELSTFIQRDMAFSPPLIIAHGLHAITAQKYVESHPASGLVLLAPFIPDTMGSRLRSIAAGLGIVIEYGRDLAHSDLARTPRFVEEYLLPGEPVETFTAESAPLSDLRSRIYYEIPPTTFEPQFPILIVTSSGDLIVPPGDVKELHFLSGRVDERVVEASGHLGVVMGKGCEGTLKTVTEWMDEYGI